MHSLSVANVFETSSHAYHVFQADFFGFPWRDDTMAQPLMAWKKMIPGGFSCPKADTSCLLFFAKSHPHFDLIPPIQAAHGSVAVSAKAAPASFSLAQ